MTSKRALARRLSSVDGFQSPTPAFEQYQTAPELAATLVHTAGLQDDISDTTVVDLGCGTGMLALGAALGDPARVVGVEIDGSALETAQRNEREIAPAAGVTWVRGDVTTLPLCPQQGHYSEAPITVVMNPPFGAQAGNEHADRAFLETARDLAAVSYSIHNAGSANFVKSFAGDADGTVTHAFAAELPLPRRFDFHETESKQLDVEIFRIEWSGE